MQSPLSILTALLSKLSKHLVGGKRFVALMVVFILGVGATAALSSAKSAQLFLSAVRSGTREPVLPQPAPDRGSDRFLSATPSFKNYARLFSLQEPEPVVSTDKLDYMPGELVLISGSGFWPNETVTLQVEHTDHSIEGGAGHEPWTVTADAFGQFYSSWFVDPDDSFGGSFVLTAVGASSNLSTLTFFTDAGNPAADLDQCGNGPASTPNQCTGTAWQNGNLNQNQAHYSEGDSVPYRLRFSNLDTAISHAVTIEWDTTKSGKHALDYLTSFDRTETTANPCSGVAGCVLAGPKDLEAIPVDNNVTVGQNGVDDAPAGPAGGDDIAQIAGNFTLFNGTITGVSVYTLTGTYAGDSSTSITITFTTTATNPVLAWGGHIGTRIDWGLANSAIAIPGSPYHMRLLDLDGSGGNQDRSLSASAVFFPVSLTIVKETNPDSAAAKTFNYTVTGNNLSPFSLTPPDGTTPDSEVFALSDDTTRTVTESDPSASSPKFDLTSLSCVQTDGGLGTGTVNTNLGTRTVTVTPKEGESITCTFVNTQRGKIIVEKQTTPDGAAGSFTFTGDVAGSISDGGTIEVADLAPGQYTSTETDPAPAFDLTNITCDDANSSGNVGTRTATFNVEAGETVKCTFTNTQRSKIIVEKQTTPDGAVGSFTFTGDVAGSISDGGTLEVANVVPGQYTSTETNPAPAFDLTNITCDDANSSGNVGTRTATFNVEAGETVKCTFTNTQRGKIIVEKQTTPDGAAGSFTFTGDAAGSISDGGQIVVDNLVPGQYSSTETNPAPAFDLTNITCDDANSSGNVGTRTATFNVEAGETVKCTFTNTQRGKIIVEKQTTPDGAAGSFTFTGDAAGSISDGGTIEVANLVPGQYSSTESDPAPAFDLTNITCDDANSSGNVGTRTATFNVEAGETVKCIFTNTQRGKIIVEKQTTPDGAAGSFTFTGDAAGSISDGGTIEVANLVPGTYTSTENDPAPAFDLTNITCDDANSSGNVGTRTATFNVEAGETVKCTFTNTQRGKIIVEKQTTPDGAAGSFTFTGDVAGSISDGGTIEVANLVPGQYSSTETNPAPAFDLTNITCDDANSSGNVGTRTATFNVEAGETVKCTFTNTQRGKIIVEKQTTPDGAAGSFTFTGDAAGSISDGGTIEVANLVPGQYSSTETNPAPAFDLTNITCNDANSSGNVGTRTATFNVEAGETVKCTFTNTQRGTIIVEKQTTPDGAAGSFTFTGTAAGTISDGGQIVVSNLVPGQYSSTETNPAPAFDLTNITCNDANSSGNVGTRTATFNVEPGESVKCTFTNTQRGMVEVLKITNGGVHPELDIKFTLYRDGPDDDPDLTGTDTQLEELSTLGDADGLLQFAEKLVPGTTYTICENPVPAGWTSLWTIGFTVDGNIVTPYNPNANDAVPQDLGIRCFDFTVTPAQTKQFEVHNDFPGGDPRTIGYWKNWSTCTGGGQAANAAKNGGPAAGFFLLDNLLPQLVGDFNVINCLQGVKVLSKQDQAGRSKSSDAAYELAAQLLAAKLNLAAGAETCPAVQAAVISGQNLLANNPVNFTGSGDYLGSKAKNLATLRAQALSLAATLDQYNNGNLCP